MATITGTVVESSSFSVMARIHASGANITQADVTSIEYQIYPHNSTTAHTGATALTVSSVIFDTLQTDARWTKDATGYNFRHDVAATVLTDPATEYEVEYKFTMADSSVFRLAPVCIKLDPIKST